MKDDLQKKSRLDWGSRRPAWVFTDVRGNEDYMLRKTAYGAGCDQATFKKRLAHLREGVRV